MNTFLVLVIFLMKGVFTVGRIIIDLVLLISTCRRDLVSAWILGPEKLYPSLKISQIENNIPLFLNPQRSSACQKVSYNNEESKNFYTEYDKDEK